MKIFGREYVPNPCASKGERVTNATIIGAVVVLFVLTLNYSKDKDTRALFGEKASKQIEYQLGQPGRHVEQIGDIKYEVLDDDVVSIQKIEFIEPIGVHDLYVTWRPGFGYREIKTNQDPEKTVIIEQLDENYGDFTEVKIYIDDCDTTKPIELYAVYNNSPLSDEPYGGFCVPSSNPYDYRDLVTYDDTDLVSDSDKQAYQDILGIAENAKDINDVLGFLGDVTQLINPNGFYCNYSTSRQQLLIDATTRRDLDVMRDKTGVCLDFSKLMVSALYHYDPNTQPRIISVNIEGRHHTNVQFCYDGKYITFDPLNVGRGWVELPHGTLRKMAQAPIGRFTALISNKP